VIAVYIYVFVYFHIHSSLYLLQVKAEDASHHYRDLQHLACFTRRFHSSPKKYLEGICWESAL